MFLYFRTFNEQTPFVDGFAGTPGAIRGCTTRNTYALRPTVVFAGLDALTTIFGPTPHTLPTPLPHIPHFPPHVPTDCLRPTHCPSSSMPPFSLPCSQTCRTTLPAGSRRRTPPCHRLHLQRCLRITRSYLRRMPRGSTHCYCSAHLPRPIQPTHYCTFNAVVPF